MKTSSRSSKNFAVVFLAVLSMGFMACAMDPNPRRVTVDLAVGSVVFRTELARSNAERQMGLMYRKEIQDHEAMLFVFDNDDNLQFWMKNVPINLSIAYIDSDGYIREIHDMVAQSTARVSSDHAVRYALEVAQGAFERRGVKVGDRVKVETIR